MALITLWIHTTRDTSKIYDFLFAGGGDGGNWVEGIYIWNLIGVKNYFIIFFKTTIAFSGNNFWNRNYNNIAILELVEQKVTKKATYFSTNWRAHFGHFYGEKARLLVLVV